MIILIWLTILEVSSSLKICRSTVKITNRNVSGIHLQNAGINLVLHNELSACLRLSYKVLGPNKSAKIFDFQMEDERTKSNRPFLWFHATNYPASWIGFHGYANWIVRERPDHYHIWTINVWHHVCLAFSKLNSKIIVVKVKSTHYSFKSNI